MNNLTIPRSGFFALAVALCALMTGCATPTYTVDDGSPVDEKLLSSIRLYGKGEQAVRPSIVKTAQLNDEGCSKQWELPFVVATSYDLPHQDKIAWARGAGVDERLTVIAVANGDGLAVGDKIAKVDGYHRDNTGKMMERLMSLREDGDPFDVITSTGKVVKITPVKICRGYFNIAAPDKPETQDYHWLQSTHPLSIFTQDLTPDEALWAVLWTQGLSEEAGMRMKTYHYGLKFVKTAVTVASIVSGVGAVANAAQAAAANVATSQATNAAGNAVASFAAQQTANVVRDQAIEAAKKILKAQAQDMAVNSMKASAIFRSSLSGISWVAGTGFYMADKWAFDRMAKLGADPIAAFTLEFKLASHGLADNALVFDEERMKLMTGFAQASGIGDSVALVLTGGATHASESYGDASQANGDVIERADDIEVHPLDDLPATVAGIEDAPVLATASASAAVAVAAVPTPSTVATPALESSALASTSPTPAAGPAGAPIAPIEIANPAPLVP